MHNLFLTYFQENFELAFAQQVDWNWVNMGMDDSCAILLTNADNETPFLEPKKIIWKEWKGRKIPFILNTIEKKDILTQNEAGQVTIHFDLVNSAWYLLSGAQERESTHRDSYNRYCYTHSIQKELNIAQIPVVNYYFDIVREAILLAHGTQIKNNRKFTATVTHDIDEVLSGWKHRIRMALEKKQFVRAIGHGFAQIIFPFHPWKNLSELSQYNQSRGIPATFFFLVQHNKIGEIKNADYLISHPYIQDSIAKITSQGHEIGIHGSYKTHDSASQLAQDITKLGNKAVSNRFHFLQYEAQTTPQVLDSAAISVDSTLGFQETIGFRNSICTPFKLYDFENNSVSSVLQVPLNIMDCSLEYAHYMNLSPDESLREIKNLVKEIKQFNGNLCINWHNTYFSEYRKAEWKNLYTNILEVLKQEGCEFKTCSEIRKSS